MSDQKKMPLPVDVWLYTDGDMPDGMSAEWCATTEKCSHPAWTVDGPHQIVPGMMSLDELAERGFLIEAHSSTWRVIGPKDLKVFAHKIPTALEAQWLATCLADKPYEGVAYPQ